VDILTLPEMVEFFIALSNLLGYKFNDVKNSGKSRGWTHPHERAARFRENHDGPTSSHHSNLIKLNILLSEKVSRKGLNASPMGNWVCKIQARESA